MKELKKNKFSLKEVDAKIQAYLNSTDFRKTLLLALIGSAFILNLSILISDIKFSQEIKNSTVSKRVPNPWEKEVREIVKGSPMEVMAPYISQKEKSTAAFLVSIAKKESNLGKFSPKNNGRNCFNYWGYRGKGENVTKSGYTCFDNPRQAVNVVSKRISTLINENNLDTPRKMAVWKCGWNCSWDNPVAVEKWISDVNFYYQKFYE